MCTFVFLGLPRGHGALVERLRTLGFSVDPNANPSITAAFPPKTDAFVVTRGGCSCDLHAEAPPLDRADADRDRYRRKGWNAAKVERAVAAKDRGERSELRAFREAIVAIVGESGRLHLLAHTFSGTVDIEVIAVGGSAVLDVDAYAANGGCYAMDTLVTVSSS